MAKKIKERVQVRLGDIYRKAVTGDTPPIKGIERIMFTHGTLIVRYRDYNTQSFDCTKDSFFNEKLLKDAIKTINKYISEVH